MRHRNECNDESRGVHGRQITGTKREKQKSLEYLDQHKQQLEKIFRIVSKYPILGQNLDVQKGTVTSVTELDKTMGYKFTISDLPGHGDDWFVPSRTISCGRDRNVKPYSISFYYDSINDKYRIVNDDTGKELQDCTNLKTKQLNRVGKTTLYTSLNRFLSDRHKGEKGLSLKRMINSDLNDDMKRFCDMDVSQNLNHQLINSDDGKRFLARNPHLKA